MKIDRWAGSIFGRFVEWLVDAERGGGRRFWLWQSKRSSKSSPVGAAWALLAIKRDDGFAKVLRILRAHFAWHQKFVAGSSRRKGKGRKSP